MHSGGRLVVPSHIREALHLNMGDELLLRVEDGELRVISRMEAIRRAQRLIAQHIPASVSLVEELIAEPRLHGRTWSSKPARVVRFLNDSIRS